jgi:hypothetical protein
VLEFVSCVAPPVTAQWAPFHLSRFSASSNEVIHKGDQGENKENLDKRSRNVKGKEPSQSKNEQDHE